MSNLFSNDDVNSGRQIEWDYAKVFAIFAMIFVHFLAFCTFGKIDYGYVEEYLFILTQSSAPIFMFAMGIGMVYTRHDSTREFVVRGIKLLLLGLVINVMYFLSNYAAGVPLEYSLLSFLANDILQFAGITFIVVGIFKKFNISHTQILLIAILLSFIVSYHPDITLHNMYLNQLLGNFIETTGQNIVSCFPFLNWFIIPAAGMLFGNDLKRCKDKEELYKLILRYTSVTTLVLLILGFITRDGMFAITGGTVPEKLSKSRYVNYMFKIMEDKKINETIREHSWIPLVLVACASFIITLDSTFMNVSISQVVADLNTDVTVIQMIMSFYTLITATFMLLGAKLQDIVGKRGCF